MKKETVLREYIIRGTHVQGGNRGKRKDSRAWYISEDLGQHKKTRCYHMPPKEIIFPKKREEIMNGNEGGVMLEKLKMTVFSLDIQDSAAESCFQSQH